MTLVILDPGLHMLAGHHFELDTALLQAAARLGVEGHIFCHETNNPHILGHPQITPAFGMLGTSISQDPILKDLDRFLLQNERLREDLRRIEEMIDVENSTLLFPTADFNSLTGLGRWARECRVPPRHLFVLLPTNFEFAMSHGAGLIDQLFYRYGFAQFPQTGRVSFLTLSARQAQEFSAIAGRPVGRAPYPVGEAEAPPPAGSHGGPLRVTVLGSSRGSKGFALLPGTIRRVQAVRPQIAFTVQYCPSEGEMAAAAEVAATGATMIEGYLDRASYQALLRSSDILLLPYLGAGYRVGTSAVFAEARWYGRPAVAASGTSMAAEIALDPRIGLATDAEPAAMAAALVRLADGFPSAADAASQAAERYRQENGTARFVELLLGAR